MQSVEVNSERWLDLSPLPNEEWRQVRNTCYSISNYGRLRRDIHTTDQYINGVYAKTLTYNERIVKLTKNVQGYWHTRISVNGEIIDVRIHRLVAEAFIPNPDGLPHINHINENPEDNHVSNLEWCTPRYNATYGTARKRMTESLVNNQIQNWHSIVKYDKCGNLIHTYKCKGDLEKEGYRYNLIEKCCTHHTHTAYGFVWRYDDEPFSLEYKNHATVEQGCDGRFMPTPVCRYSLKGDFMQEYPSMSEAAKDMKGNVTMIAQCCNEEIPTAYGFLWRLKGDRTPQPYKSRRKKVVLQYTKDMELIAEYPSIREAARIFTGDYKKWTSICECCSGKAKTYKGYIWKYAKEE